MTKRRALLALSIVAFATPLVVVCCSWPSYQADLPDEDVGPGEETGADAGDGADTIVPPVDTGPIVVCGDSGLKAGQAASCTCGDAGPSDAAPGPDGRVLVAKVTDIGPRTPL